jgi:hypothetical protein
MIEIDPGRRFKSMDEVCERISRRDLMVEIAGESYRRIMRGGRQKQVEFFGTLYWSFLTKCKDAEIHFRRFQPLKIQTDAAGGMRRISVDGEWHEQFTKLKQAVLLLLAYASLKENEEPTILTEYAVSHKERGIPRTLYEPFQECLIDAAVLADEWWRGSDADLRAAWKEATKHGIEYMMEVAGPGT